MGGSLGVFQFLMFALDTTQDAVCCIQYEDESVWDDIPT